MSHVFTILEKKSQKKLSEISFGAFSTISHKLVYESLDANKFNNGVSGSNEDKNYSLVQLKTARNKLKYLAGEPIENLNDKEHDFIRQKTINAVENMFKTKIENNVSDESIDFAVKCIDEFLYKAIETGFENFIIRFH